MAQSKASNWLLRPPKLSPPIIRPNANDIKQLKCQYIICLVLYAIINISN